VIHDRGELTPVAPVISSKVKSLFQKLDVANAYCVPSRCGVTAGAATGDGLGRANRSTRLGVMRSTSEVVRVFPLKLIFPPRLDDEVAHGDQSWRP
jgi:hypothetical protein